MKAVLCPVCEGKGKVLESITEGHVKAEFDRECHGCLGKGWVEVSEETIHVPSVWIPDETGDEIGGATTICTICSDDSPIWISYGTTCETLDG